MYFLSIKTLIIGLSFPALSFSLNMCNIQTSFILGALSFVPGNTSPYITLGLASVLLAVYTVHHYGPTQRLARLEDAIMATETILEGAKLDCARDHMTLVERRRRLLECVPPCSTTEKL
ncbi:hypothetical protein B0H17DRAFT_40717 [Mycena rosella]|uniref:Uncharacterized protein n=1 Tax=Mycena rosella TaxID=1033263 RepID=A0AAD7M6V3_MYCRO|nr:hypothetical protein B0H17DRAFT_40717 [Mycena rosella]